MKQGIGGRFKDIDDIINMPAADKKAYALKVAEATVDSVKIFYDAVFRDIQHEFFRADTAFGNEFVVDDTVLRFAVVCRGGYVMAEASFAPWRKN